MTKACIALTTCGNTETAENLARSLVEKKLAACVNIIPQMRSIYAWQGEIHNDSESLLLIKTSEDKFDALTQWCGDDHPYDVPELVMLDIDRGLPSYLQWLSAYLSS